MSDARNLGETAIVSLRGQPSAEIVRVGCAKPIGETTFVRERGQPSAEIVRVGCAKPIGETAFVRLRGQPSAEIVRVGCAKPRRNCVTRFAWSTLCGDRACRMCEMYAVPHGALECTNFRFCECLVRNAHFGRSLCPFLRMSRTKRSFWKVSLSVFANVLHETLILEDFFVCFCECLVRNACFGRLHCPFLRTSRTKRSFWKIFLTPSKGGTV